jgi:hypothetical protein
MNREYKNLAVLYLLFFSGFPILLTIFSAEKLRCTQGGTILLLRLFFMLEQRQISLLFIGKVSWCDKSQYIREIFCYILTERNIYSMKTYNHFFMFVLMSALILSCHSSKKEIRSEQTRYPAMPRSTASEEKKALQDSSSSLALQKRTSIVNDTVVGVIYVTGNEPFTHLMLTLSPNVQYLIEADSSSKAQLWQLQGKRVSVIGIKKTSPMGTSIQTKSFHQSQ